ncbi:MAG: Rid family hydrolase, partial [Candidatus Cloacimonetes bacterium]|nr:Rid family hydrolase [Candidatus Cloacimonadota bacterium]
SILEKAGSDMSKVVKTTVLLSSMDDFAAMNKVYESFFTAPFPARACFSVKQLPKNACVEIECVAEA